jgi:hypothetical protein
VGEKLVEIPEDGSVLRHFYQNFNIKATKDGTDTFTAFKRLKKHQAGIISLAETNSNWKNGLIRENFRNQMFKNWENCKYRTSTSNWKSNSLNKPGGTITMATNRWSGRASMSGEDPWGLGRFSYIGTEGKKIDKKQRKLMFITLYRVCDKQTTKKSGAATIYRQEWNLLRNNGVADPNPRAQVIEDLISFIKSNQQQGYEIILAGDAYESMRKLSKIKGFGKLMDQCQLQDFHRHLPLTATHSSGSQPIDCIVGSALISDYVIRAGYTAFYIREAKYLLVS